MTSKPDQREAVRKFAEQCVAVAPAKQVLALVVFAEPDQQGGVVLHTGGATRDFPGTAVPDLLKQFGIQLRALLTGQLQELVTATDAALEAEVAHQEQHDAPALQ